MRSTEKSAVARAWGAWTRAGEKAAHIVGMVLFALLWGVALAPIAVWFKVRGRRLLPSFKGDEDTYYLPKEPVEHTLERMRRQW